MCTTHDTCQTKSMDYRFFVEQCNLVRNLSLIDVLQPLINVLQLVHNYECIVILYVLSCCRLKHIIYTEMKVLDNLRYGAQL